MGQDRHYALDAPAVLGAVSAVKNCDAIGLYHDITDKGECCTLKQLAVKGKDIVRAGFAGKAAGEALNALLSEVMDGGLQNERQALLRRAEELCTEKGFKKDASDT